MSNNIDEKTIVSKMQLEDFTVKILYIEFSGGGTAFEYEMLRDGVRIELTRDGFGNPAAAAAAAFGKISDLM